MPKKPTKPTKPANKPTKPAPPPHGDITDRDIAEYAAAMVRADRQEDSRTCYLALRGDGRARGEIASRIRAERRGS